MPKIISPSQLSQLMGSSKQKPIVIDIRSPYEFSEFHIPGAVNIPYQSIVMYPEKFLTLNSTYFLICDSGSESYRACMMLEPLGYRVVSVQGGYANMRLR